MCGSAGGRIYHRAPMRVGQSTEGQHLTYFSLQFESNEEFWRRFGGRPEFAGKTVLDLGCGQGAMTVDVAQAGATVVGVDLDEERVEFARRNVALRHPDLAERVSFECARLESLGFEERFDVALSKDTFEHVDDMDSMLQALHRVLTPGGELWAGFSPLYFSPWGDHGRTGLKVPWAHAVLPRRSVLRAATRLRGEEISTLADLGLNGMTPQAFRDCFRRSPFEVVSLAYNRGDKPLLRALDKLRRLRGLERFSTVSMYVVLRRPTSL
jgi:ubiquinone/menaquinone biosynthesis C-methylase UbiE